MRVGREERLIEYLKTEDAVIFECPECRSNTLVDGVCVDCMSGLKDLTGDKAIKLRKRYQGDSWKEWVIFCLERGYKPIVIYV